jgi:arylsulfatase A-like enzyme
MLIERYMFNAGAFYDKLRLLLISTIVLLWISGCQKKDDHPDSRPNIIFLMADDHRADALGFLGNEHVMTPNLDRLASNGVVFRNAYHVAPICLPSRTSVMTGQYLGTHGAGFDRPTNYVLTEEEFKSSYPVLLRNKGYFTGFIGKFGFAVGGVDKIENQNYQDKIEYMPISHFDVWNGFPGQGSYQEKDGQFNGYENQWKATHLTAFMGFQAIDFLRKAKDAGRPFCLSVSFKAPHAPFQPAEEFRQKYDSTTVARMTNDKPDIYTLLPEVVKEKSRNARWYFGRTKDYYGNELGYRQDWHIEKDSIYQTFIKNYYALITGVDNAVGRIRAELENLGLDKNTVIIYTSDNGFFAGSKQLMGKALLYEESAKAPMIVYDPSLSRNEGMSAVEGLISHVDIAPTLLDIAGIEIPGNYPGKSFMPIVKGEIDVIHEAVYGENNFDEWYPLASEVEHPEEYQSIRSKFVRTSDYKYIRYHENHPTEEELYKIDEDPTELNNLISDSAYTDIASSMRTMLDEFEREYVKYEND